MRRFASWRTSVTVVISLILVAYGGLVGLRLLYPIAYTDELLIACRARGLDPPWVAAIVRCESRFDPAAESARGALGLMQIMPETGRWIAERLEIEGFSPEHLVEPHLNLKMGTWYLDRLLDRFPRPDDALAAYNAGPSRVDRWLQGVEAPYPETLAYVERVERSVPVYRFYFALPWLLRIIPSCLP